MDLSDFLLSLVSFEPNELEDIMSCFEKKKIKKNTMLIAEGEVCRELYFVESGMGRRYYLKEDGKEITQWFFGSGTFMTISDSKRALRIYARRVSKHFSACIFRTYCFLPRDDPRNIKSNSSSLIQLPFTIFKIC